MSRIGKAPIALPSGVEAKVEGTRVVIKSGKYEKGLETHGRVNAEVKDNSIVFTPKGDAQEDGAFWGTYRSLASNIVTGLSTGFTKKLEINGVGYRAAVNGNVLEMALGYSHPIHFEIPEEIEITVEKSTQIMIKGIDKQVVGQVAAKVRSFRPPEPYKGKGVKYADEVIIRKAGKTAKK
jgi:large subunit ribosomal protein L6